MNRNKTDANKRRKGKNTESDQQQISIDDRTQYLVNCI